MSSARTNELGTLGLSTVEERVYRHVVATGDGAARMTAQALRLPVTEVEQAFHRLQRMGLIARSTADALTYVPGQGVDAATTSERHYAPEPPVTTLGAMLRTQAAELIKAGSTVEHLARLYERRRPGRHGVEDAATVVVGREVNEAVYDLLCTTRHEIMNLDRQPFVPPSDPHPVLATMLDVLERGVTVRTVYAADAFRVAGYAEYMRQTAELGEQARLLDHLPQRFMVSDATTAMLPLSAEGPWITAAIVVRGHELVEDLARTFEDLWTRATPMDSALASGEEFTESDRVLLRMLATDMTDTAMGRHLTASPRTIGRRVAQLQAKLGAQSRFGMGVEAARRGLL